MANDDKQTVVEIQRLLSEIEQTKNDMRTLREQLKDVMEQNDEYKRLEAEIKELTDKRQAAKQVLLDDTAYQKLHEELEDYKFKSRDLNEILSAHLIEYYQQTQRTEVPDKDGSNRPLIISAKVGKTGGGFDGATT